MISKEKIRMEKGKDGRKQSDARILYVRRLQMSSWILSCVR